jgi:cell wall-associated NlpC family hydrolase
MSTANSYNVKDAALSLLATNEGGWVASDTLDTPTVMGITYENFPEHYNAVMNFLNRGDENGANQYARNFFYENYWVANELDSLRPDVAIAVFDGLPNHGFEFGRYMLEAARNGASAEDIIHMRELEYQRLVIKDRNKYEPYLDGWMNRLARVEDACASAQENTVPFADSLNSLAQSGNGHRKDEIDPDAIHVQDLFNEAAKLVGTPYYINEPGYPRPPGTTGIGKDETGIDCSGFTTLVFEKFGIDIGDGTVGQRALKGENVEQIDTPSNLLTQIVNGQKPNSLKPGDLLHFDITDENGDQFRHVILYAGMGKDANGRTVLMGMDSSRSNSELGEYGGVLFTSIPETLELHSVTRLKNVQGEFEVTPQFIANMEEGLRRNGFDDREIVQQAAAVQGFGATGVYQVAAIPAVSEPVLSREEWKAKFQDFHKQYVLGGMTPELEAEMRAANEQLYRQNEKQKRSGGEVIEYASMGEGQLTQALLTGNTMGAQIALAALGTPNYITQAATPQQLANIATPEDAKAQFMAQVDAQGALIAQKIAAGLDASAEVQKLNDWIYTNNSLGITYAGMGMTGNLMRAALDGDSVMAQQYAGVMVASSQVAANMNQTAPLSNNSYSMIPPTAAQQQSGTQFERV